MNKNVMLLVMLLVAATAWTVFANQARDDHQPPSPTAPVKMQAPAVTPAPATGRVTATQERAPAPATGSRKLELPDGTFVDSLNDTIDAPPLKTFWGPFAWSPITGIERSSAGIDWYTHADGSYSTTQMVWRDDLGRNEAMTRVAHPGPAPANTAPAK